MLINTKVKYFLWAKVIFKLIKMTNYLIMCYYAKSKHCMQNITFPKSWLIIARKISHSEHDLILCWLSLNMIWEPETN